MKASEFRIGNLVWDDYSGEMQVAGIYEKVSIDLRKSESLPIGAFLLKNVQPLPLTPEWLERFGFVAREWREARDYKPGGLPVYERGMILMFVPEGMCQVRGGFIDPKIEYVHQLQNLYFALTGSELILDSKLND